MKHWWRQLRLCLAPRCAEVSRLSSRSLDQRLALGERLSLRLHFLTCVWCRRYHAQLYFLRRAFRICAAASLFRLSAEAKDRMERKVREQQDFFR